MYTQKLADRIKHRALSEKRNVVKRCEPFTLIAPTSVCVCACVLVFVYVYIFSQFHFLFTFKHFIDRKIQIKEQRIKSIAKHTHTGTWPNKAYGATQSPLRPFFRFANAFAYKHTHTHDHCRQIDRESRIRSQHNTA